MLRPAPIYSGNHHGVVSVFAASGGLAEGGASVGCVSQRVGLRAAEHTRYGIDCHAQRYVERDRPILRRRNKRNLTGAEMEIFLKAFNLKKYQRVSSS